MRKPDEFAPIANSTMCSSGAYAPIAIAAATTVEPFAVGGAMFGTYPALPAPAAFASATTECPLIDFFDEPTLPPPRSASTPTSPSAAGPLVVRGLPALPAFNDSDPRLWLKQVENTARSVGIADDRQLFYAVSGALPRHVATRASDLIYSDDARFLSWQLLKQRLYSEFEPPRQQKIVRLLEGTHREGNERPTAFQRRIMHLAEGMVADDVLLSILLHSLPSNVRQSLILTGVKNSHQAALAADEIFPFEGTSGLAARAISTAAPAPQAESSASQTSTEMQQVLTLMQQLLAQSANVSAIASPATKRRSRSPTPHKSAKSAKTDRSKSRGRAKSLVIVDGQKPSTSALASSPASSRSSSRPRAGRSGWCWYHRTFGTQAEKCSDPPCTWWDLPDAASSSAAKNAPKKPQGNE